jgi:hypothetical protein
LKKTEKSVELEYLGSINTEDLDVSIAKVVTTELRNISYFGIRGSQHRLSSLSKFDNVSPVEL